METLYFTRYFTRGILKGLTHHDQVSFPTMEDCMEWVKAINSPAKQRTLEYKVIDYAFQKYDRN